MSILHLLPAYAERLYGAGNWKACQAMRLALADLGSATARQLNSEDGSDLPQDLDGDPDDIVLEYSRSPETVGAIRRRWPAANVHVRAHNAEAWQHLHRSGGVLGAILNPRTLYGISRLLARDSRCRQLSRSVLSISEWDSRHYWSRLPGRAAVVDVPYFSPWPELRPAVAPRAWADRDSAILCLPGARDPIGQTAVAGFFEAVRGLSRFLPGWRFAVTGGFFRSEGDLPPPPGVDLLADLTEPWDLLCRIKAVAVLTPLGFGAKTTIFDALAAGCHALVHPSLARRLPRAAQRHCVEVDSGRLRAAELAAQLEAPPLPHKVNAELRQEATAGLRSVVPPLGKVGSSRPDP